MQFVLKNLDAVVFAQDIQDKMKIDLIQIGAGIFIGILICYVFPNLPNKLKEMASNFQKLGQRENGEKKDFQNNRSTT